MDSMNLMPVGDSGWGNGGAAALGAFVGSWFGNGFGGGGYGGRGIGAGAAVGADVAATALISDLATLQGSVNQNALALANGVASVNQNLSGGLSNVYSSLNGALVQGMMADQTQTAAIQSTLCQGFSGLNSSVYQAGVDTRFAINALSQQSAECCCQIKGAIAAEGSATRALINDRYINDLQTQLCDAKAKIGSLESNAFLAASQTAQTNQIIQTVLAHLPLKV
jgi:hypothetical protein